jgi:hypothetical protein
MTKQRHRSTQSSRKPQQTQRPRWPQLAILGAVALVDVNVYDEANARLLQRAQIRAIPTQIFLDQTGQGWVSMGAMAPDQFREQMRTLVGGQ